MERQPSRSLHVLRRDTLARHRREREAMTRITVHVFFLFFAGDGAGTNFGRSCAGARS
jgi:hypothetical protein